MLPPSLMIYFSRVASVLGNDCTSVKEKTLLWHFFKLNMSQLFTRTPRGFPETSLHLHKHEKKGRPTFPSIDYLETNFEERKTGRIPHKRTKEKNNAKPRLPIGRRESLGRCLDSTNQSCAAYSPAVQKLSKENFE